MWALLGRRARLYLLFALGAPLAGVVLKRLSEGLERGGGETVLSRGANSLGDLLQRQGRGPLATRLREQQARRDADRPPDA